VTADNGRQSREAQTLPVAPVLALWKAGTALGLAAESRGEGTERVTSNMEWCGSRGEEDLLLSNIELVIR